MSRSGSVGARAGAIRRAIAEGECVPGPEFAVSVDDAERGAALVNALRSAA
ncbi:hypothetical protein [Streptomyces sp. WAC06614]|uniref:hypothetical protein n=1 Tax=Streptomyces sp. WAC06614 TaxID=2487416 RepID=UPI00163BD310|nr:hypothetical protein [Streptomyces sp. WAC06614]